MNYFKTPATLDQLKAQYRDLAKHWHPDVYKGTQDATRVMQEINAEYEALTRNAYQQTAGEKYSRATEDAHVDLAAIIDELINLSGIVIEICGTWLWIGGDTRQHAATLKAMGFRWSAPKKRWYFAFNLGKRRYGKFNMEQIRATYGSAVVASKGAAQIG